MIFTQTAPTLQPTFVPDDIKSRILCFGDSLTWSCYPLYKAKSEWKA